ncbi:MAG: TonB-dependent siderophore receptor, partial [Methylococcales bacterium]
MNYLAKRLTAVIVAAASYTMNVAYADAPAQTRDAQSKPSNPPVSGTRGAKTGTKPAPAATPGVQDNATKLPKLLVTGKVLADDPEAYNVTHSSLANKTDTPVMETPFSIQTVPQQVIKDQQVVRIERALQNVSGVFQNNSTFLESADEFNIRGFRSGGVLFRDGMRFDTTAQGKRDPANLERIEVLKGPASFLFGRIEPGGLINLSTKQPLDTPYYSFAQQFGSFDFYRTTLDATGPITADNRFGYRANLAYENAGSFREFVNHERTFVAPKFQWNLAPSTKITISLDHLQQWGHPDSVGLVALGNRPAPIPRGRNLGESWSTFKFASDIVVETLTHEFNEQWKVQQVFNYNSSDSTNNVVFGDISGFPPDPIQNGLLPRFPGGIDNNQNFGYYNALNLIGKFDTWELKHNVLIGGDFFYNKSTESIQGVLNDGFTPCQSIAPIDIFNPVHTGLAPPDFFDSSLGCDKQVFNNRTSWYGLYLQDQVELPFNIFLLGGFRYDNAQFNTSSLLANTPADLHQTKLTPRGGVLWRPVQWLSFYGSYAQSLGSTNVGSITTSGQPIAPETAEQWEGGIKTEL